MKKIILFALLTLSSTLHANFRDKDHTHNSYFDFLLKDGRLYFKPINVDPNLYKEIALPKEVQMAKEVSVDGEILILIDSTNRIFYSDEAMKAKSPLKWRTTWGFPFAYGPSISLPDDTISWDISYVSPEYDKFHTSWSGNHYRLGQGCTTLFILRGEGNKITYIDPWLPSDYSYQTCAPRNGRFKSVAISSSGSTMFVIGKQGDMFTRSYDFDLVGADTLFFNYTFEKIPFLKDFEGQLLPNKIPKELPIADWKRQPKIKGLITDRISIEKEGIGLVKKTLLVEGQNEAGETGFFTKDINDEDWKFVATDEELKGNILENQQESEKEQDLAPSEAATYVAMKSPLKIFTSTFDSLSYELINFNAYCSPATLKVTFDNKETINLLIHSREGIRMARRGEGLSKRKFLPLLGTIEIPEQIWNNRKNESPQVQEYITRYLKTEKRFIEVDILVNPSILYLGNLKMGTIKLKN